MERSLLILKPKQKHMELKIRGVSKTYASGMQALKDVTLTTPAGMYGLLGGTASMRAAAPRFHAGFGSVNT